MRVRCEGVCREAGKLDTQAVPDFGIHDDEGIDPVSVGTAGLSWWPAWSSRLSQPTARPPAV
jgi:hypothetical protein